MHSSCSWTVCWMFLSKPLSMLNGWCVSGSAPFLFAPYLKDEAHRVTLKDQCLSHAASQQEFYKTTSWALFCHTHTLCFLNSTPQWYVVLNSVRSSWFSRRNNCHLSGLSETGSVLYHFAGSSHRLYIKDGHSHYDITQWFAFFSFLVLLFIRSFH